VFNAYKCIHRPPSLSVRGIAASAVLHGALLGIALGSRPAHVTSMPRATGERVQQIELAYATPDRAPTRGPAPLVKKKAPPLVRDAVVSLPVLADVPTELPLPRLDTEAMLDAPLQLSAGQDALDVQQSVGMPRLGSSDGSSVTAVEDGNLDTTAVQLPENPKPNYPVDMLRQAIEAQFVVYYVIDSTGLVDTSTIEIPASVRTSFAEAVKLALSQWHYYPAHRNGRAVRQFVGQEFMFRIVRPRQWDGTSTA
jgi:hypothetical protein